MTSPKPPPARAARLASIAPFEVMEVLDAAQRLEAAGHDVIHLEVGEPDFPTPGPVVDAAARALRGAALGYTPALGLPALRAAIARHYADAHGVDLDPARVVVTPGSSAALLLALGMALDPGALVLMADPAYPCNRHFATFVGGGARLLPAGPGTGYQPTAAMIDAAWTPDVGAVIVASPSNPTGTVIARDELAAIAALCRDRGATLIVDEIYGGLVYDAPPSTVLDLAPDAIVINSFSKYHQMTGWRLGWMVVPERDVRDVEKLAQNLYICAPTPAQHAALAAFAPETLVITEERRRVLAARRDVLLAELPSTGLAVRARPAGAFYVYCDATAVTDDSFAFARDLLREAHVALTPGRDFGLHRPDDHIRIAYTQDTTRLVEACARIRAFVAGRTTAG